MQLDLKYKVLLFCLSTLLIFLPLNTLLVQFLVVNLGLPVWLTLWKELLAGLVILICSLEVVQNAKFSFAGIWEYVKLNFVLVLLILMTFVGLINSVGKVGLNFIIYGFRFELFWLWLWVMLYTFFKMQNAKVKIGFVSRLLNSVLIGFFLSSLFSLITIFFGTDNILSFIGYGRQAMQTGSEFLFVQPAGHLIDAGGWNSSFRLSGTFSSPNHYATYLILLLPLFITKSLIKFKKQNSKSKIEPKSDNIALKDSFTNWLRILFIEKLDILYQNRFFWVFCLTLNLIFLGLTFARFSYLVLFVFLGVLVLARVYNVLFGGATPKGETLPLIRDVTNVQHTPFKGSERSSGGCSPIQNWLKNIVLGLVFLVPLLISLVVLNLPVSFLQSHFPSWLAKPSSTEWHQQHTAAAFRTLTYESYPNILENTNLKSEQVLLLSNLQLKNQNPEAIVYRMLTGYGMGTTDPASKYLPLEQNPIVNLGFGIDDEKYFARQMERPLATTPENWFLGLWVKGGIFYMLLFLGILVYFSRDARILFHFDGFLALQKNSKMLKVLVSLSIFGLIIAGFLLDIFDSQSLALLIGPIYFFYLIFNLE